MPLLAGTIQPAVLTLLSSTSKPVLWPIWTVQEGSSTSSFIEILQDCEYPKVGSTSRRGGNKEQPTLSSRDKEHVPQHARRGSLRVPVIHLQSPRPDTYISTDGVLGVTLPYLGFQIKPLGKHRGMSIEISMADTRGRIGIVRLSSWKKQPTLYARRNPPLAHLPLALPQDAHMLTDWAELSLHLPSLMALFRSLRPGDIDEEDEDEGHDGSHGKRRRRTVPAVDLPGPYASTSSVRVYASCRLRRVWFSAEGDRSLDTAGLRDEWALYAN